MILKVSNWIFLVFIRRIRKPIRIDPRYPILRCILLLARDYGSHAILLLSTHSWKALKDPF
jgi:hypothetical protein